MVRFNALADNLNEPHIPEGTLRGLRFSYRFATNTQLEVSAPLASAALIPAQNRRWLPRVCWNRPPTAGADHAAACIDF
jgi:hypothetical protein